MPPMDDPMMGGGPDPMGGADAPMDDPMGGDMPMDDPMGDNGGDEGDSQLQKLAGEISQELRDYNQAHPDDENGMNKYVLGMVSSAAAGTLKTSDIKKIKANLEGDGNDDDDMGDAQGQDMGEPMGAEPPMQESRRGIVDIIDEIANGIMDADRKQTSKRDNKKLSDKYDGDKDNPFISQW